MKYLIVLFLFTSCVSPRIEDRCLAANLKIDKLVIEANGNGYSSSHVSCKGK